MGKLRFWILATGMYVAFACCACGGGNGAGTGSLQPAQTSNPAIDDPAGSASLQLVLEPGRPGAMLKRQVFNYSYDNFPQQDGIYLVPMSTRTDPDLSLSQRFSITTAQGPGGVTVKLRVESSDKVLVHLRFDPGMWQLGGVTSKNVWGTDKFLATAAYPESGLLVFSNIPVGRASASMASGEFAEIELLPADNRQTTVSLTPGAEQSANVIWLKEGGTLYEGQVHFRLDGALGDYDSKDDTLSTAERSAPNIDNFVQDVGVFHIDPNTSEIVDGYGRSYFGSSWEPLYLNWTEFFRGDHDNSGYIDIYDITPIGQHWSENGSEYYSARGIERIPSVWLDLYTTLLNDTGFYPWRKGNYTLNSMWYLNQDLNLGPTFFNFDAVETPIANALDSNWDGFVQDWPNFADDNNPLPGLDSYYDEPGNGKYHPGDLEGMYTHWNEEMSGYEVWTVPTGGTIPDPDPQNPEAGDAEARRIVTYYRQASTNTTLHDSLLNDDIDVVPYDEDPWTTNEISKAQFSLEFANASEFSDFTLAGGYDIVIRPYYYDETSDIFNYGSATRIVNAVYNVTIDPLDTNGPVYRPFAEASPNYQLAANLRGIKAVSQTTQYKFAVQMYDADDVDISSAFGRPDVNYFIYALRNDNAQPTDVELFAPANLLNQETAEFHEDSPAMGTGASGDPHYHEFEVDLEELGRKSMSDTPGARLWFGVRCSEIDPSPYTDVEYAPVQLQNKNMKPVDVTDKQAPYFVFDSEWNLQTYDNETPHRMGVNTYHPALGMIEIEMNQAIDRPAYRDSFNDDLTYRLYLKDSSFGGSVAPAFLVEERTVSRANMDFPARLFSITSYFGQALNPADYYAVVTCTDSSGNTSEIIEKVVSPKRLFPARNIVTTGLTLEQAQSRGALIVEKVGSNRDAYLLAPSPNKGGFPLGWNTDLSYARFPSGTFNSSAIEHNLLQANMCTKFLSGYEAQSSIALTIDGDGFFVEDQIVSGAGIPIICWPGQSGILNANWDPHTAVRSGTNAWVISAHSFGYDLAETFNPVAATTVHAFSSFAIGGPTAQGHNRGDYFLFGIQEPPLFDGLYFPTGDLQYKSIRSNSMWATPEDTVLSTSVLVDRFVGWPHVTQTTDIITRDLSRGIDGNSLYIISSSPTWYTVPLGEDYELIEGQDWQALSLNWVYDPVSLFVPLTMRPFPGGGLDLIPLINSLPSVADDAVIGPNSMEAVRSSSGSRVYIAFNSESPGDVTGEDGQGLSVAYLTDNGSIPASLTLDPVAGLVDDQYAFVVPPEAFNTNPNGSGTTRIVDTNPDRIDLKRKPSANTGATDYVGLGILYVSFTGQLYLQESQGALSSWNRDTTDTSYIDHPIDEGFIPWAKLAYLDNDKAAVLYCISDNGRLGPYSVKYWVAP